MNVAANGVVAIAPVEKARGYWRLVGRRLARDPVSSFCAVIPSRCS